MTNARHPAAGPAPRRWIGFGIKAALAIAALTGAAHWTSRSPVSGPDAAQRDALARAEALDPVRTGSLRARNPSAAAPGAGALDQHALSSLVAQTQADPARPPKKR